MATRNGHHIGEASQRKWQPESFPKWAWWCPILTIWLFNIAMGQIPYKWRFLAGKIIYKWAMASTAMLNNQRVSKLVYSSMSTYVNEGTLW